MSLWNWMRFDYLLRFEGILVAHAKEFGDDRS